MVEQYNDDDGARNSIWLSEKLGPKSCPIL